MENSFSVRIALNIMTLTSVIILPWWVSVIFILVLITRYRAYEILFWGFLLDILYSSPIPSLLNTTLLFTIISLVVFILADITKKHLIFYTE